MKMLIILLFVSTCAYAQKPDLSMFTIVEQPATYPGGQRQFVQYIIDSIKVQPNKAGRVIVKFAIDTTGLILSTKTTIVQAPEGMIETFGPELIRVINASPVWMPGRQHGKAVRQQMALPIVFQAPK
jgi:protein TonB